MGDSHPFQFKVSAPGKIILHGEHSVCYGKPALASAIAIRNNVMFKEHDERKDTITFAFQALNIVVMLNVNDINNLFVKLRKNLEESGSKEQDQLIPIIREFIPEHLSIYPEDDVKFKTILSTLYLMSGIFLEKKIARVQQGFSLEVQGNVRLGAGLGSSASFAVCISTVFLILSRRGDSKFEVFSPESQKLISEWAFNSEKIMHGKPSGIDNTVCTFGGIINFTNGLPMKQIKPKYFLDVLLVDTKVERSTAKMCKRFADLKKRHPQLMESILTSMGKCAEEAAELYLKDLKDPENFRQLADLFNINNCLLKAMDVSHYKLDEIFLIAQKHQFPSKLTGAGGGGYAIILLPFNYEENQTYKNLCADLDKANFPWTKIKIGGTGVEIEFL